MKTHMLFQRIIFAIFLILAEIFNSLSAQSLSIKSSNSVSNSIISLDGEWLLVNDPKNVGKIEKWWETPVPGARPVKVPWIIQDVYPAYHGVVWYWRDFIAPKNNFRIN